jgi:murein DD-endopeptidase MepM/ murein hydrolase activator NlpD
LIRRLPVTTLGLAAVKRPWIPPRSLAQALSLRSRHLLRDRQMTWRLSASVGRQDRARNNRRDVETVQTLLASAARAMDTPAIDPGGIDGRIAASPARSSTVSAIEQFQMAVSLTPDGVVEANGRTFNELVRLGGHAEPGTNPNPPGQAYFPFATLPGDDWKSGMRAFGASRGGGTRAHAGCDLYFPQGTWIHAVANGRVIRGPTSFFAQTYALEVDHGDFLVRYCEVQPLTPVRAGDTVHAGDRIARVGRLVGVRVPSDMLHIEIYDKSATGPLTVLDLATSARRPRDGVTFGRRRDLVDPTGYLDDWSARLPG